MVVAVTQRRLVVLAALVLAVLSAPGMARAGIADSGKARASVPPPVASLEPAATAKLWRKLVATRDQRTRQSQRAAACRPLRAVFWAATDYLRLATKLAAAASPCADYYISVPPIVGNKTQVRPDAAWRIRALGPNFHALAEIHFTTWSNWVASTGSSWYTAGVTARQRMAAAGYDVTEGDTWVVNELSTAVRRGTGNARANIRELLRGLYDGDGTHPTRGAALVVNVGQQTTDTSLYQTNLQNWYSDSAFWTDMSKYVSDWSQEVYGDVRNYAVAGAPLDARRDYLNDYLYHGLVLAQAAPPAVEPAKSYLASAYSPLANAAWQRESGYGWTMVPANLMQSFVSAQVYALRHFSSADAQPQDHWGFTWAPRNAGLSGADYIAQTGAILDRLAVAIRDSADTVDPEDPGSGACGPPGQNVWCVGDVDGGRLNPAWQSFRAWTQPVLTFSTPPQTIPAGTPSGPISLSLLNARGGPQPALTPLSVAVSSSSPQGTFSTSPTGPWSPTLSLTIAAGTSTSPQFYYLDTRAGAQTLTASAAGLTSGTQIITVLPGAPVSLAVTPRSTAVRARATQELTAVATDSLGNRFPVLASWSVTPGRVGTLSPSVGNSTTFTAARSLGRATVRAIVDTRSATLSAEASVNVTPARLNIALRLQTRSRLAVVSLRAVDAAGQSVSGARIYVVVRRDGRRYLTHRALTGPAGRVSFRVPARRGGCFTAAITRVSAAGFTWDGRTPTSRVCLPPAKR
jgi:hypothetical protein